MIRKPISKKFDFALIIFSLLCIAGAYSFLSIKQHRINPLDTTIPNLTQFITAFEKLTMPDTAGNIWLLKDCMATGERLFGGLAVGIFMSFVVGLGMGVFPIMEGLFKAPITFWGKIPPTAMLAVYFVVFGIDLTMYVAMVALGIFPALTMAIFAAAKTDVSDHEIYKAYTLGASSGEVIWEVVVQQILPRIIENVRLIVGPALVFLVAAEWMMSDIGFGYRLRIQSRLMNMNVVYLYLVILAGSGFAFDWTLVKVRRFLCPWFELTEEG